MKTPNLVSPWNRFWPVFLVSLLGLWPLAARLKLDIGRLDASLVANGDPTVVLIAALAQSFVLLLVTACIGAALAQRVGLTSLLAHRRGFDRLRAELPMAMGVGASLGAVLAMLDAWIFKPLLPNRGSASEGAAGSPEDALLLGVLYGGISEEVITRWGLMTLICWGSMRLSRANSAAIPPLLAWIGILLSAGVFALGHLPATALAGHMDAPSVYRALSLNTLAGTMFGWLYWRRSLESACVAHALVHVSFYLLA